MSIKLLKSWAGLISLAWMAGIFELLNHAPENFFLFQFDPASWRTQMVFLGGWLGVGLLLALTGLRFGKFGGRICAVIAIGVFIFIVFTFVHPAEVPGGRAERLPAKSHYFPGV